MPSEPVTRTVTLSDESVWEYDPAKVRGKWTCLNDKTVEREFYRPIMVADGRVLRGPVTAVDHRAIADVLDPPLDLDKVFAAHGMKPSTEPANDVRDNAR